MLHWTLWNNRQGERSSSPDVAPLSPLSRPFAKGVENLPRQSLCAPKSGRVGGTRMGALTGDLGLGERKQEKGLALFCARPATSARSADSFRR